MMIPGNLTLVRHAYADQIGVELSSERFFGQAMVRVVIVNPSADHSNAVDSVTVDIEAHSKFASDTGSFVVPETNNRSGRFEFFLEHSDATAVNPNDVIAENVDGIEGATNAGANPAPVITFGPSGSSPDLVTDSELYKDVEFHIFALNNSVNATIFYERTIGTLQLDRDSYGSDNFVYVSISDQDANLNPTARDEFVVHPNSGANRDLLSLDGGTIIQSVTFVETGDNTGVFEGEYRLGLSIISNSESLVLTLNEKSNYNADLGAEENDSNLTDSVSFTVGNTNGNVEIGNVTINSQKFSDPLFHTDKKEYSFSDLIHLTVNDSDANTRSEEPDTILLSVYPDNDTQFGKQVLAVETAKNSGVFSLNFTITSDLNSASNSSAIVVPANSTELTISYTDKHPSDYLDLVKAGQSGEKSFIYPIQIIPSEKTTSIVKIDKLLVKDGKGNNISFGLVGAAIELSTALSNGNNQSQPFAAIFEVRDSFGVTVFLGWSTSTLPAGGQSNAVISWTPDKADDYQIRTFVISGLDHPQILTPLISSFVLVN